MILLLDIGKTHTHPGLAKDTRVLRQKNIPTAGWRPGHAGGQVKAFAGINRIERIAVCSVVPRATRAAQTAFRKLFKIRALELNYKTVCGIGVDYPKPATIGADRLANAVAVKAHYGAPAVVVDF